MVEIRSSNKPMMCRQNVTSSVKGNASPNSEAAPPDLMEVSPRVMRAARRRAGSLRAVAEAVAKHTGGTCHVSTVGHWVAEKDPNQASPAALAAVILEWPEISFDAIARGQEPAPSADVVAELEARFDRLYDRVDATLAEVVAFLVESTAGDARPFSPGHRQRTEPDAEQAKSGS